MIIAPASKVIDLTRDAAVDTRVDLGEYTKAWQRATMGKPLHFDNVEIIDYYIDVDELKALNTLFETKDPNYKNAR